MFRKKYPAAWTFHQNSCRSEINTLVPQYGQALAENYKEYFTAPSVALPPIKVPQTDFTALLFKRFSCRKFSSGLVGLQQLSNILFSAYGLRDVVMIENDEFKERTVPSGGGLYPLEFYVIASGIAGLQNGIYHYVVQPFLLEEVRLINLPKSFLQNLFMNQPYVADAAAIVVCTSVVERSMKKYADRGYRYILYEAGHAFQNMNLMCAACDLGAMNIGGFFDSDMCSVLGIDSEIEIPLYAMAMGIAGGDAITARMPEIV